MPVLCSSLAQLTGLRELRVKCSAISLHHWMEAVCSAGAVDRPGLLSGLQTCGGQPHAAGAIAGCIAWLLSRHRQQQVCVKTCQLGRDPVDA